MAVELTVQSSSPASLSKKIVPKISSLMFYISLVPLVVAEATSSYMKISSNLGQSTSIKLAE